MKTPISSAILLAAAALASVPLGAEARVSKPTVDPYAVAALERMGAFLRSQKIMQIRAETTTDDVLDSGQKIQIAGVVELKVSRPDRLRADIVSDRKNEQLFYDGKTFTVYQPRLGYYASFAAPPTLAELVDVAEQRYGLDMPLADLFYWGTDKSHPGDLQSAMKVGTSTVRGVACDHLAFRQADVDWEIWIEKGQRALPHKVVITTITERSQPQHVAILTWDLAPALEDVAFTFKPPPAAHQIDFETAAAAAPRQGRASHPKRGAKP